MLLPFWSQVVAEASAEAENPAVKASSRASLGLKLDHTEVLRWAPISMRCLLHMVRILDECSPGSQGCELPGMPLDRGVSSPLLSSSGRHVVWLHQPGCMMFKGLLFQRYQIRMILSRRSKLRGR